jgi:hypothetical protein
LENSIPQGRGFLKKLVLRKSSSPSVVDVRLSSSLTKVVEVLISLTIKASPGLKELSLFLSSYANSSHLDSGFEECVFGLEHLTTLSLIWNILSIDNIKKALKQGGGKCCEVLILARFDQDMGDKKICSYLPKLRKWSVIGSGFTVTVEGAREWKRICPKLSVVKFNFARVAGGVVGRELSEEVIREMKGLGITALQ